MAKIRFFRLELGGSILVFALLSSCGAPGEGEPVEVTQQPLTGLLRPTSDISKSSITNHANSTTNVFQAVDDGTLFSSADNDVTYARTTGTTGRHRVGYSGGPSGTATQIIVNFRARRVSATGTAQVQLFSGSTLLATGVTHVLNDAYTDFRDTFTNLNVTNVNNLRTEITLSRTSTSGHLRYTEMWLAASSASAPNGRDLEPDLGVTMGINMEEFPIRQNVVFTQTSGEVIDGCIKMDDGRFPGPYRLLPFGWSILNLSTDADFVVGTTPPPMVSQDPFVWSAHGHHHVENFNDFTFVNASLRFQATNPLKQAACLMDSSPIAISGFTPPAGKFTCQNQGITTGWDDEYGPELVCQFIDISNVPDGTYVLLGKANAIKRFSEADAYDDGNAIRIQLSGNGTQAALVPPVMEASLQVAPPTSGAGPWLGTAISWGLNRYDTFQRNPSTGELHHTYQDEINGGWGDGASRGGTTIVGTPTVASWDTGRLDTFAKTTSGNMGHWWFDGGWGFETFGVNVAGPPAAISSTKNRITVFFVEPTPLNRMILMRWDGNFWSFTPLGSTQFRAETPAVAASGAGTVHIMARELGTSQVKHSIFSETLGWSGDWINTAEIGISTAQAPSAVSVKPNSVEMWARGSDNELYQNFGEGSRGFFTWTGWQRVSTPTPHLASAPFAISTAPRQREIFYYQNSSGVISLRRRQLVDGSAWVVDPAVTISSSTSLTVRPFVSSFARNTANIFQTLTDGSIRAQQRW